MKDEVPNGTLENLIPFDGVLNKHRVSKLGNRLEGDHVAHLWGWIEKPILQSSIWKCSYVNDTIEGGPMMWVSFAIDRNKHEGKWLVIECRTLKMN